MREKIAITKQLRLSKESFSKNPKHQKLCSKCYHEYVFQCIMKGKESFEISFGSKYFKSFSERMYDWYKYIINQIHRFFLIIFTPNDDQTIEKHELIHQGVVKPVHIKIADAPDEMILYYFLKENGFKIVNEHLYTTSTVYDVVRA